MGAQFEAKFANFVGYLTDTQGKPAPRTSLGLLEQFLMSFAYAYDLHRHIGGGQDAPMLSNSRYAAEQEDDFGFQLEGDFPGQPFARTRLISYTGWAKDLSKTARIQLEKLSHEDNDSVVFPEQVATLLAPLRRFFTGYQVYAMVFPNRADPEGDPEAQELFKRMAYATRSMGLVFMPINYSNFLDFLDPFPCVQALSEHPTEFPAVVFWTPDGSAVSLGLKHAAKFFDRTVPRSLGGSLGRPLSYMIDDIKYMIDDTKYAQRSKRILHLSDLHFGKPEADERKQYLISKLEMICSDVDRVVVTGDLFDNPTADLRGKFDEFRANVERFTKHPLLLIPGNHDVLHNGIRMGPFSENFKHVANLWNLFEIDHDLKTAFFCFNSCEEGSFAKGNVSRRQRLDMAAAYNEAVARDRDGAVASYTKIALVHHHPLPFENEPEPETGYQKLLQRFVKPDRFAEFENADEFNNWCQRQKISLILHGHKHFPRQSKLSAETLVVGCGSTTGVENTPMCYDIVTLNDASDQWSVTFYMDENGDGGGFEVQAVTLPS